MPIPETIGIAAPATWETAGLSFQVSNDNVNFYDVNDSDGAEVAVSISASNAVGIDAKTTGLYPFGWFKIRSGTATTPVPQGAAAATGVFSFGEEKTLTVTAGLKGPIGEELSVRFETAVNDTLAAEAVGKAVVVKMAADTGLNNSASAIQTLIRTLTVADIDVTGITVAESEGYAASRPTATKAVQVYAFYADGATEEDPLTDLGELTITAGHGGAGGNFIASKLAWMVNEEDALSVTYDATDDVIIIALASTTPASNAASAIQAGLRALTDTPYDGYLTGLTVTADATWTSAPPVSFDGVTYVEAGSTEGADIEVPEEKTLTGGTATFIDVALRR